MRAFILEMMACSRIMDTRITSEARRAKPTNEARRNLRTLSLKFRQFVWVHLQRKFAQLLAYIERLSGGSKQRVRFAQVPMNTHTCHIHSRKIELRVGIPAIGSPAPQFDRILEIPTATLALNKHRSEPSCAACVTLLDSSAIPPLGFFVIRFDNFTKFINLAESCLRLLQAVFGGQPVLPNSHLCVLLHTVTLLIHKPKSVLTHSITSLRSLSKPFQRLPLV